MPEHLLILIGAQSQGFAFQGLPFSFSSRPCKTLFIKHTTYGENILKKH
jgi:hypothetical protein